MDFNWSQIAEYFEQFQRLKGKSEELEKRLKVIEQIVAALEKKEKEGK